MEEDILHDTATFFEFVTEKEPYKYQKKFLRCNSDRIAVRSGRQVGKSLMAAIMALCWAFMNTKQKILVVSAYQKQASEVFQTIKNVIRDNEFISHSITRETLTQIHFDNGSILYSLPAGTGKSIRGYSPNLLILDEAAFVPDKVWEAIEPSISVTKGTIILLSTPWGTSGFFYNAFKDDSYAKFHIKASQCPNHSKEFLAQKKKEKPENVWMQEYEGEFIEEADTWFPTSLIKKFIKDIDEISGPRGEEEYVLAVDIARKGDDETLFGIAKLGTPLEVVKLISTSKKPVTDTINRIKDLNMIFNFKRIYIDDSSFGSSAIDILNEKPTPNSPDLPIFPCDFHVGNKAKMYQNLKVAMENNQIKCFRNDKMIEQLESLKYELTAMGNWRFFPPDRGHDDYVDCLVMLARSCTENVTEKFIMRSR